MAHIPPTSKFRGRKNAFKKEKIYNFLKDNIQLSTREIQDLMNNNTKWGITMTELGNILARTPEFEKIGFTDVHNINNRMRVCVWGLKYES